MRSTVVVAIVALLAFVSFSASESTSRHQNGYCAMYDNCGKKSVFGSPLPCVANIKATRPSPETAELLQKVCGDDFDTSLVCCSEEQVQNMESNLKRVDPIISSCPACRKNFYDFFCKFTCSPDQSKFVNITNTATAADTKKEIVTELTQFVDPKSAKAFYVSCENVKFSATNGYAMDLIGGGAKNYSQFLKFLGDEKPFLGGSPFQINFQYQLTEDEKGTGIELRKDDMKPCDDETYKCACSDCPKSCPKLPRFKDFRKRCYVGKLPCFTFSIVIIWICLILLLGGYHIYLANLKKHKQLNDDGSDLFDVTLSPLSYVTVKKPMSPFHKYHLKLIDQIEEGFARLGYFCATYRGTVIGFNLLLTIFLSMGLFWLNFETDPVNLWVSPQEPALKNKQYFESNFGEWFRIEQVIISNKNDSEPILNWENIQWWFEKEAQLESLNENVSFSDICFKPLGETCGIQSFTQYFYGDIRNLNENNWRAKFKSCTDSPVNCLPSFQQPLKKNILFDSDNIFEAKAFTVTLLVNSNSTNKNFTDSAVSFEHSLQEWVLKAQEEQPGLNIAFSTEVSLTEELNKSTNTDVKIIVISYLFMFLYASLALGGKLPNRDISSLVKTRFALGLCGIIIILLSVTSSIGIFAFFGLKSTLIIAEVIPFLVLAIGIDNIFLIVHELHLVNESVHDITIELRIAQALKNIGPSCLISALIQVSMFYLATRVDMPAVKNFAYYSAGAVLINFLLQMTMFVSLLAVDQHRLESNRLDCFPWIVAPAQPIALPEDDPNFEVEHSEYDFASLISKYYAPFILSKTNKPKFLTLFVVWFGISLSLLPHVNFGLDQRIALPSDSYLINYFDSVYNYLNVGPPVFFVVKDIDITKRTNQQKICGKFSTCDKFSVANILEQEYKRGKKSTIAEPTTNWLDDFLTWLNPNLDQCCRFKKSSPLDSPEFCSPNAPERQCDTCFANHDPPYDSSMEGLPTNKEFMFYFNQWIQEPSDPCPLGGKAPYSTSISRNDSTIFSSYFRTGHSPLRSQGAFINAYKNSIRIVEEIKKFLPELDIFAFSPFYVFFVQYETIVELTFTLLGLALVIIWGISVVLLGSVRSATVMVVTVLSILVNIGGVLSIWDISLNAVSLVNLVICAGLAVEFTIHITRAYTASKASLFDDEMEDELYDRFMDSGVAARNAADLSANTRLLKAFNALTLVGGPVLGGITFTKIIGISVLAFTRSKIFEVYYFRMWIALIFISAVHALCLLPILLSYFGDDHKPTSGVVDESQRCGDVNNDVDDLRRYSNFHDDSSSRLDDTS
ncbi:sterol-sensing domain of SREBP cleavage-activation-domain-containing protein [Scheffersomyces xylosifermentans]|uniref:sterol-sensing domain of SREBP cleavage-activation-domain-containing protein n=1 Tax=Scheffersomyces xylosifermentans TaxID=1304137 RepID=UPI00315CEB3D